MSENSSEAPQIDPFERAKRRFLEQLPEDQQRTFLEKLSDDQRQLSSGASIESLFYKADVLHKEYESSSTVHAFRETLRPFFNILENYSKALDVASNIGVVSTVLAPLWGGLRVILQVRTHSIKSQVSDQAKRRGDVDGLNAYAAPFFSHARSEAGAFGEIRTD